VATDDVFLSTYVTTRTHVVTLYGLQTLVAITKVPRIAAKVQEVRLVVRDLEGLKWHCPLKKKLAKEKAETRKELKAEMDILHGSGKNSILTLLATVLTSLADCGQKLSLVLSQGGGDHPFLGIYGTACLRKGTLSLGVGTDDSNSSVLRKLLIAIAVRSPKLRSLNLLGTVLPEPFRLQEDLSASLLSSVSTLTSLGLSLTLNSRSGLADRECGEVSHIRQVLETAVNLQDLRVSCIYPRRHHRQGDIPGIFTWLEGAVKSPKLSSFKLGSIAAGTGAYISFMRKYMTTLKELGFRGVYIHSQSWDEVLKYTHGHLELEKLTLSNACCSQGALVKKDDITKPATEFLYRPQIERPNYHCFQGQENVKKGIDIILAGQQYAWTAWWNAPL
jgi:hypothetical protein